MAVSMSTLTHTHTRTHSRTYCGDGGAIIARSALQKFLNECVKSARDRVEVEVEAVRVRLLHNSHTPR